MCSPNVCARYSRAGFPRVGDGGKSIVLLMLVLVSFLLGRRWHRHSCQRPTRCTSPFGVVPVGSGDGVGDCHDAADLSNECLFIFPLCIFFFWRKLYSFFQGKDSYFCTLLGIPLVQREPTPCYRDAYSVDTPRWAYWEKGWQKHF